MITQQISVLKHINNKHQINTIINKTINTSNAPTQQQSHHHHSAFSWVSPLEKSAPTGWCQPREDEVEWSIKKPEKQKNRSLGSRKGKFMPKMQMLVGFYDENDNIVSIYYEGKVH
jgi:hypothetical protein